MKGNFFWIIRWVIGFGWIRTEGGSESIFITLTPFFRVGISCSDKYAVSLSVTFGL